MPKNCTEISAGQAAWNRQRHSLVCGNCVGTNCRKIALILPALIALAASAAPKTEWRTAVNHQARLYGWIIVSQMRTDLELNPHLPPPQTERLWRLEGNLSAGWQWGEPKQGYFDCAQLDLCPPGSNSVLVISKPSMLREALERRCAEEELARRLTEIEKRTEVRFREKEDLEEITWLWDQLSRVAVASVLEKAGRKPLDLEPHRRAVLALKATTGRLFKILSEDYRHSIAWTVTDSLEAGAKKSAHAQEVRVRRPDDSWNADVDHDGRCDIKWVIFDSVVRQAGGSGTESIKTRRCEACQGSVLAVAKRNLMGREAIAGGDLASLADHLDWLRQTQYGAEALRRLLLEAASSGNPETIKLLLSSGADVNARDPSSDCTRLHVAAAEGRREPVEVLLSHGADVHAQSAGFGSSCI
jgi:hypothetical protein